jgi:hypothetical protein
MFQSFLILLIFLNAQNAPIKKQSEKKFKIEKNNNNNSGDPRCGHGFYFHLKKIKLLSLLSFSFFFS